MSERTNSQLVGATLIGGMIGAGLALLFAPRSGEETRAQIGENMARVKDKAADKLHHAKGRMRKGMDDARELKDRLTEAATKTGKKAQAEIDELKQETTSRRRQSPVLSAWEEEV